VTSTDVALVQGTFRKILPIADQAAALFYARLFELDPALRTLFRGDMHEQGRKLIAMIETAVSSLASHETPLPADRELGARPRDYRITEEPHASIGAALLWTLQKGLGSEFTPAVAAAWTATCSLLATTLIEAQRSAAHVAA
jgi:hemoglobin-like flavoprotein